MSTIQTGTFWGTKGRGIIFTGSMLVTQTTNRTQHGLVMADIYLPIALVSVVLPLKAHGRVRGLPSPPLVVTRALSIRILRVIKISTMTTAKIQIFHGQNGQPQNLARNLTTVHKAPV